MVEIHERGYNFFTEIWDFIKEKYQKLEEYFTLGSLKTEVLRKLFEDSKV